MEQKLNRFSLQFFAEEDEEDEEVEVEDQEETSEEDEEDEDFQDGEETSDDVVEEETSETHTEGNKKQTKRENEYFKKLRLSQKQQQNASKNSTYEEGRINGILEAVKHTNPFTNEKIEDDEDIQEFLIMREMKEKGLDPVEDYSKYLKEIAREKRAEAVNKKKEADFISNDIKTFSQKFPDKKIDDVMNDTDFVDFASASIGKVPLADLYENYQKFTSSRQFQKAKEIEEEVNKSKARSRSSSGNLSSSSQPKKANYEQMSDAKFEKLLNQAKLGKLSKKFN